MAVILPGRVEDYSEVFFHRKIIAAIMKKQGLTRIDITEDDLASCDELESYEETRFHQGNPMPFLRWRFERAPSPRVPSVGSSVPDIPRVFRRDQLHHALGVVLRSMGIPGANLDNCELRLEERRVLPPDLSSMAEPTYRTQLRFTLRYRETEQEDRPTFPSPHRIPVASVPLPLPSEVTTHGAPPDVGPAAMQAALEERGLPPPQIGPFSRLARTIAQSGGAVPLSAMEQVAQEVRLIEEAGLPESPRLTLQERLARWFDAGCPPPEINFAFGSPTIMTCRSGIFEPIEVNIPLTPEQTATLFQRFGPKQCCRGGCTKPRQSPHAFCSSCYEDFLTLTQGVP